MNIFDFNLSASYMGFDFDGAAPLLPTFELNPANSNDYSEVCIHN